MPQPKEKPNTDAQALYKAPGPYLIGNPPQAVDYAVVPENEVAEWEADGWHRRVEDAVAALKAPAPTVSAEVEKIVAELSGKTNAEIDEYAAGLGVETKAMNKADKIAAVQAALLAASAPVK